VSEQRQVKFAQNDSGKTSCVRLDNNWLIQGLNLLRKFVFMFCAAQRDQKEANSSIMSRILKPECSQMAAEV
jgi:hypothetical protein